MRFSNTHGSDVTSSVLLEWASYKHGPGCLKQERACRLGYTALLQCCK